MRKILLSITALCFVAIVALAQNPKREFRGAWMHTVFQSQYSKQSTEENKKYLCDQLDKLQDAGVNAIVFQVRPQADALYPSDLEPWSRHLTGKSGVAPSPMWDPLQFMIDESHARGMELHAWLNPYRVTTSPKESLAKSHIYNKHPERFVSYDGKKYFDPGLPENRKFIDDVIKDIITRYDVDAIHMDDYFYPYPKEGVDFPDSASYEKYGNGMERGDWRRHNVDLLIEGIHKVITENKPWVRLGISPFGIWRNKTNDPMGSETSGLQNYDALYADVLLWTKEGWVDYMLPQLYWELEHKKASTEVLAYWWNEHANGRHMYYGQDVNKTMSKPDLAPSTDKNQLAHKIRLSRELPNVQGNCWWPAYSITKNYMGVADSLARNQQSTIALVPAYTWIDSKAPEKVEKLRANKQNDKTILLWNAPKTKDPLQQARAYVVYRFDKNSGEDISDSKAIQAVTYSPQYTIPAGTTGKYTYVVTTLDRVNNESESFAEIEVNL
ncbi:MAG: family 10 glycosylhydrolase [Muribaculaceae bacterium]